MATLPFTYTRQYRPCDVDSARLGPAAGPEISPYGAQYMHTPNMQALADDGFVCWPESLRQADRNL